MPDPSPNQPAKPGTACLGCRRRKLKCSREQKGCANCTKADLPCVYPVAEAGVKRKRGPYKKDKPAREKHLEDLVRYLEPKATPSISAAASQALSPLPDHDSAVAPPGTDNAPGSASVFSRHAAWGPSQARSEDLVKDALIALTQSATTDQDSRLDPDVQVFPLHNVSSSGALSRLGIPHPPLHQIFEYWHLFVTRVDPLMKIIHCPTFAKRLHNSLGPLISSPEVLPLPFETLLFTTYFAAVRSCTNTECSRKFGERQVSLLQRYGTVVEKTFNDSCKTPDLETLQALLMYLSCVRRQHDGTNTRALFTTAKRMAYAIGLQNDPDSNFTAYEAEIRRRLWWNLCGLESRGAEDGGARNTSIMANNEVQLPANLNDNDLDPKLNTTPHPRVGVTQMTWPLLKSEIHRFIYGLWCIRRRYKPNLNNADTDAAIRAEQEIWYVEQKARLESHYIQYLHDSRPYDWMCATFTLGMLLKARVIIDHPEGFMPCKEMPTRDRKALLQACVDIIQGTHVLGADARISDWSWYYRGFVQWNCLAIVIGELGHKTSQEFNNSAWAVLDPILAHWDKAFETNRGDAAWEHVNGLIERARQTRRQRSIRNDMSNVVLNAGSSASQQHATANLLADPLTARLSLRLNPQHFSPFMHEQPALEHSLEHLPLDSNTTVIDGGLTSDSLEFNSGNAMTDIDGIIGSLDSLDGINFEAFDEVFGSGGWDLSGDYLDPAILMNTQVD